MKKSREGFTLAELLIVVAIIAVLVAVAIPVFGSQLEKSREAADLANVRAAYRTRHRQSVCAEWRLGGGHRSGSYGSRAAGIAGIGWAVMKIW